jgi:hypothetical protein
MILLLNNFLTFNLLTMSIKSRNFNEWMYLTVIICMVACNNSNGGGVSSASDSLSVFENFIPSGWMGDGEDPGRQWLDLDESSTSNPHSTPSCVKVSYRSGGTQGWAGIYWQNVPNNWCRSPGADFSQRGFTRISFWAKGENGGEVVEFKAGGIRNCAAGGDYSDSFETGVRRITLDTVWRQYSFDLSGKNLNSVIGGFCWSAPAPAAGNKIFYIDDVYYH